MSDLDDLAREVANRRQPQQQSLEDFAASLNAPRTPQLIPHYATARYAPPSYRQRVGHRSFLLQIIFAAWTTIALFAWFCKFAVIEAPAITYPGTNVPIPPAVGMYQMAESVRYADMVFWSVLIGAAWAAVAVPAGIAAIVTMERRPRTR